VRSLHDVQVAISVHEQQQGHFSIDLRDMAFEDGFREYLLLIRISANILNQLVVGDSYPEFDNVKVTRVVLLRAIAREIEIRVIGQNSFLFKTVSFSANGPNIHSGYLTDSVV
jgi:hypothetical protein